MSAQHLVADAKPSAERVRARAAKNFMFVCDVIIGRKNEKELF